MGKEVMLSFVTTIIENGVKNNLSNQEIYASLENYAKYLKESKLADEATTKYILDLAKNLYGSPTPFKVQESPVVAQTENYAPASCGSGRTMGGKRC